MQEGDQEAICTCKSSAQPAFVNVALSHGGESLAKTEPGIELTAGRLQPVMDDGGYYCRLISSLQVKN